MLGNNFLSHLMVHIAVGLAISIDGADYPHIVMLDPAPSNTEKLEFLPLFDATNLFLIFLQLIKATLF